MYCVNRPCKVLGHASQPQPASGFHSNQNQLQAAMANVHFDVIRPDDLVAIRVDTINCELAIKPHRVDSALLRRFTSNDRF